MSTEYYSNILYEELLKNLLEIEIKNSELPKYVLPHKLLHLNGNSIFVFEGHKSLGPFQKFAIFERFGEHNPREIFDHILKQFKSSVILEQYTLIPWPECGGYP